MSKPFEMNLKGDKKFQQALKRNPETVLREVKKFIQRGIAEYKKGIINNPWRVGMTGGGSPVLSGNLRDTHLTKITSLRGRIYPTADYTKHVHKNRPWMDYVFKDKMPDIKILEKELLDKIVTDLAN